MVSSTNGSKDKHSELNSALSAIGALKSEYDTNPCLKNIPDDYETKYEQIVSKLDNMLYGRKLTDKETVEFIKKMLQK